MAAITDKFNKAANGTGAYPSIASVTAVREKDGSVLMCDDLAGWSTETPVHFSTYRLMSDGTVDTSTQSDWKGIVSGNTITQITRIAGNSDNGHLIGDKVELNPTIGWLDDLITGILRSHNQDGTLKDSVVSTNKVVDKAITNAKIAAKAVKSDNVDWEAAIAPAGTNVIRLGARKIMWGEATISLANGEEKQLQVDFPEEFNNIPEVVSVPGAWLGGTLWAHPITITKTYFRAVCKQNHGNTQNMVVRWIAMG